MTHSIPTTYLVLLAAAFAALQVLLGAASLDDSSQPAPSVSAMVLYSIVMTLLLLQHRGPVSTRLSWSAILSTGTITVLVQLGLPHRSWPGYAAWHAAAIQCLLVVLAVRGRTLVAATGCTLFATLTLLWASTTQPGIEEGLRICLAPVLFVFTAVALARFLALNDRRAETKTKRALDLLDEAATAKAHTVEAAAWVEEIRALASPSLILAANPSEPLKASDRERMLATEATLRDRIRGGSMATQAILKLVSDARAKGIAVHLLDDRGEVIAQDELHTVADTMAVVLEKIDQTGTLTVRARPAGQPPKITVVFTPNGDGQVLYIEM